MSANEKMPIITNPNNDSLIYGDTYIKIWHNSLQQCEIIESEFEKIGRYLRVDKGYIVITKNEPPIEVTDIVYVSYDSKNDIDVIEFKEQPKQVEEIEAVDEMFLDLQEFTKEFVKIHEQAPHPFDVYFWIKENNKYTITRNI